MQSNWIITSLGLTVVMLGGCSTVHRPLVMASHPIKTSACGLGDNTNRDPISQKNTPSVSQVGFQEVVSDEDDSPVLESPLSNHKTNAVSDTSNSSQSVDSVGSHQIITLADFEQIALSHNPTLVLANAAWEKSAGLQQQVGTRPNPTLGYFASQLADQATDQQGVFLEQEFVRGNKLALNREVLRHTNEAQQWEIETQRYRILTDVRVRFYEAVASQRQLDATIEFAKVASRGLEVATNLQEAGEGTTIDVLQSKTLLSETNLAKEQAEAAYRGAWKDLAAISGTPDLPPAKLVGEFETQAKDQNWDNAYAEITAQSPELAAARAIVCEKRAFLQRQQIQMTPNVTTQFGAGYDRATDSGLINLQIGVPIPVRNRNCGNIAAASADFTLAVENVKRIEMAIKSRLARTAQEYESASASVQKYQQEIIPQASESLALSEKAYTAGELDFLQVLTVRRNYYESTIRFIQAQAKLAQASVKVDGLLLDGGLAAPQDYTNGDGLRGQSFGGQ